jgi:lipid-A-disaccharide synthase
VSAPVFAEQPAALDRLAMVAGEASGDVLSALLLQGLRQRHPALKAFGIGGRAMVAQGFDAWWSSDRLAVRGYVEVLRHYADIVGIRRQLAERLLREPPSLFMGVDAPDFNLDLACRLKAAGVATVQYVCPAVWAWRPERVQVIGRSVDHVLCVFPFEPALLHRADIAASYVGHPLAQVIPMVPDRSAAREALGLDPHRPVLALLPGSRHAEVAHLLQRFLLAAQALRDRHTGLQVVLPAVPALQGFIEQQVSALNMQAWVQVVAGQSHAVLAACDVVLVASGTATLEAALFKRPMVIAYHMNALSWWITRRKKLQPWVGLPNILCQSFVVPERLQEEATPDALANELHEWLINPQRVADLQGRFSDLHVELRRDTCALAAPVLEGLCRSV